MNRFQKYKKSRLERKDKSSIQEIDPKILDLCNTINSLEDYCTLSSCSGRIVLLIDKEKKLPDLFLFRSHDLIKPKNFKKELDKITESNYNIVSFKQEPCLVTLACSSLEKQRELFSYAQKAGFGRCGIITTEKNYVLELMCTEKLEFPVISQNKILVDDDFLDITIKKSNQNLKKGWKKIEKLNNLLKK
jgi:tRNA wybutosine-synthesizing protein 3